jgi:hypothetical protein
MEATGLMGQTFLGEEVTKGRLGVSSLMEERGPMTGQEWLKREGISGVPDDAMWASLMEAYAAHVNKELVKAKTNALGFLSLHRTETAKLVLSDVFAKYGGRR